MRILVRQENFLLRINFLLFWLMIPLLFFLKEIKILKYLQLPNLEVIKLPLKIFFVFLFFVNLNGLSGGWCILPSWPLNLVCLSFTFWASLILSWILSKKESLMVHFSPEGINIKGLPPIVLIERRRIIVRPFTLRLRLIVNISAGILFFLI